MSDLISGVSDLFCSDGALPAMSGVLGMVKPVGMGLTSWKEIGVVINSRSTADSA